MKKFTALLLATLLCLSASTILALAEGKEYKNPQTLTIAIPEIPGFEITMTGVYDMYACIPQWGNITDKEYFFTFTSDDPTITFNDDVMMYEDYNDEIYIIADNVIEIGEIESKAVSMIVTDRRYFPNIEMLQSGDYEYENAVRIVFRVNTDGRLNAANDELNGMVVLPISNLAVGKITEPEQPTAELVANPTNSTVLVNGAAIAFDAYNINDNNYFKLRDIAYILSGTERQFEVGFDESANAISLTSGQPYAAVGGEMTGKGGGAKSPTPTNSKILLNGVEVQLMAYNIEGNNYFKLRDIGKAFDFGVTWDGAAETIRIDTNIGYTE